MSFDPSSRAHHVHTIPINDIFLHGAQKDCWCHPTEISTNLWAHNAKDCREAMERITGEQSSDGWVLIAEYL
jgi:hypothetical protein